MCVIRAQYSRTYIYIYIYAFIRKIKKKFEFIKIFHEYPPFPSPLSPPLTYDARQRVFTRPCPRARGYRTNKKQTNRFSIDIFLDFPERRTFFKSG